MQIKRALFAHDAEIVFGARDINNWYRSVVLFKYAPPGEGAVKRPGEVLMPVAPSVKLRNYLYISKCL